MLVLQGCTAVVTGTAGCAGTTLQREPTPLKTAPIIFLTLTPQVSSKTPEFHVFKGLLMQDESLFVDSFSKTIK